MTKPIYNVCPTQTQLQNIIFKVNLIKKGDILVAEILKIYIDNQNRATKLYKKGSMKDASPTKYQNNNNN